MSLKNLTQNIILADHVEVAKTFWQRLRGLLGRPTMKANHVLWIHQCNNIHTLFMKFPIDVVFVNKDLVVLDIHHNVNPWVPLRFCIKASSAFEFPSQPVKRTNIQKGDQLYVGS